VTPPEAGPDLVGVVLAYFWDCKLETQFCPGMMNGNVNYRRRSNWVFLWAEDGRKPLVLWYLHTG